MSISSVAKKMVSAVSQPRFDRYTKPVTKFMAADTAGINQADRYTFMS